MSEPLEIATSLGEKHIKAPLILNPLEVLIVFDDDTSLKINVQSTSILDSKQTKRAIRGLLDSLKELAEEFQKVL